MILTKKWWISSSKMLLKIIKEHNALFGIPDWKEYITVLHFTNSSRGGLEHEDSQNFNDA